ALTNLAEALASSPCPGLRLFQMGPCLAGAYPRARPQYNVRMDPWAFARVMTAAHLPHLVMSHTTWALYPSGRTRLGLYPDDPLGQALRGSPDPAHRLLWDHLTDFVASGKPCTILHDPLTVLACLEPGLVDFAEAGLWMDEEGTCGLTPVGCAELLRLPAHRTAPVASALQAPGPVRGIPFRARISLGADYERARQRVVEALFGPAADDLAARWRDHNAHSPA
ncbi:MAG: hypothetical protein AB1758_01210, partial [Candidatus Eremiobacterota bacterium]